MLDWKSIQEKAGGNFKNYYADGKYKAKCDGVEIKEVGSNGSVIMKFHFEDGEEAQYPTADHWLSFKNDAWRQWHNRCLMVMFGASDEAAKKAVEMAEGKTGKENVIKGYEACYKKLLAKKPEVDIEVYTDDNGYARAEFIDRSVAMPRGDAKATTKKEETTNVLDEAEEVSLSDADLPF